MTYKYILFGLLSGLLWALHLWQIENILVNNLSKLSPGLSSLIIFSLNELVSLLILSILKGNNIIVNFRSIIQGGGGNI